MGNFDAAALLPGTTLLVGYVMTTATFSLWNHYQSNQRRHSPLSRPLLRTAGLSLRQRMSDIDVDLACHFVMLVGGPLLAFTVHLSSSYFMSWPESVTRAVTMATATIICGAFTARKNLKLLDDRKKAVLGLEGELATAEELNLLMRQGCYVFHDIQYRWGNIDHVVVGDSGVFSVSTKVRGKPKKGDDKADVVIDYRRGSIQFPDYSAPIPDLQREAKWLADTLTSAFGKAIQVEPILALPGWFIKQRIGTGMCVINPINADKFFVHNRQVFPPEVVKQIAHQLEQLCRNVEPSFRESPRWNSDN